MSEESDPEIMERAKSDVEMLEYDYMKHISTLSLVTLGGILSLLQLKGDVEKDHVVVAIVLIAFAGACALASCEIIIQAKKKQRPLSWYFRLNRAITVYAFGIGIGVFLNLFLDIFQI